MALIKESIKDASKNIITYRSVFFLNLEFGSGHPRYGVLFKGVSFDSNLQKARSHDVKEEVFGSKI